MPCQANDIVVYSEFLCNRLLVMLEHVSGLKQRPTNCNFRLTDILYARVSRMHQEGIRKAPRVSLHCYDICWASFVCFLVLCTPCPNNIAQVVAFVLNLCIITHDVRVYVKDDETG